MSRQGFIRIQFDQIVKMPGDEEKSLKAELSQEEATTNVSI